MLSFIVILLLLVGKAGEALQPHIKAVPFQQLGTLETKVLSHRFLTSEV
jgi:hypothetical protein